MFDKTNITNKVLARIGPYTVMARAYVLSLRDVRNLGLLVFVVIVLLISWSGVKSIQTNYMLQQEIARLSQENDIRKLQNTNLELQNEYYNTPQYLEIAARQNLGLSAPGETELLISDKVALAHTVEQPRDALQPVTVPEQPFWQRNFQKWIDFFLHRQPAAD